MLPGTQRNACLSCRQRKLKCDRQQPCANCIARSAECKQQLLPAVDRGTKRPREEPEQSIIPDILSRLDHIEAYIKSRQKTDRSSPISAPIINELNRVEDSAPAVSLEANSPPADQAAETVTSAAGSLLVRVSACDNILHRSLMHNLSISIAAGPQVQQHADFRCIQLPPQGKTLHLFQVYFDSIGQSQHIIYEPHSRNLIEEVYYQVAHVSTTTAPRGLALILAVVAMAVNLEPLHGDLDTVLPVIKERLKVSSVYIRYSMDCLEQHRRRMDHTLENVQAMLVLQFLINHIEAFSPRYRALLTEAVMVSHSLGLHLIDSTSTKRGLPRVEIDPVTQEMKRRVWWYLAATDWIVSMATGPFDAVYLVQPGSTISNAPRHVNDEDLGNPNIKERPLSEPTTMSYVLQRLKLSEIARCISDVIPHEANNATCETILSLDSKLESMTQNLPAFFRLEATNSEKTKLIDKSHPYIPIQRLSINLLVNVVRCRLHFPYLPGHPSKSLHVFSRLAGLKAARCVLSMHQNISTSEVSHSADFMKIQGMVSHLFIGALTLATDLCCNQSHGEDRECQLSELAAALKQLDGIKQHSQIAAKFLGGLTQLLVKYGVFSSSNPVSHNWEGVSAPNIDFWATGQMGVEEFGTPFPFDDLWEMFVARPSVLDMIDIL